MSLKPSPAVVIPADRPASLAVARSLGRRAVPVYAVDADPLAIGMASRYVRPVPLPGGSEDDRTRLALLLDLGRRLDQKAVLYPVSDDAVLLCSAHREELQEYYLYVMPDHRTINSLLSKDGLHEEARECDVSDPRMFRADSQAELAMLAGSIPFPVILKPVFSPSWLNPEIISMLRTESLSGPAKVVLCRTVDELTQTYAKLASYDGRVIVQEVIPGEDSDLVYICFYLNRRSEPLAIFAGRKLRVLPVGFGSATYVCSFRDPALEHMALKLLEGTRYQGLGGIEFKKDPRDGCYKLIEFNVRLGMWDFLGARCGIDIPYIAYCDALGETVAPQRSYRPGVFWIDFQRDLRAFLIYRRQGKLSLGKWFKSLWVEMEEAVYSPDDPKPAIVSMFHLLKRPANLILRKLSFKAPG